MPASYDDHAFNGDRSFGSHIQSLPELLSEAMRLHGDTVFIPENQAMRLENGCIIN
jgi:hypothetical protein